MSDTNSSHPDPVLTVRPYRMDDADCLPPLWRDHIDDLRLLVNTELNGLISAHTLRDYCLRARHDFLAGSRFLFNIVNSASDCSAGEIRIQALSGTAGAWEVGFWLARRYRGQRLMRPLLLEVFATVFRLPSVRRVYWRCRPDDFASQALALHCGFTRTTNSDLPDAPFTSDVLADAGLLQQPLFVYHRVTNTA